MKLTVNNQVLESNGLNQSTGFKIEASLKAFEILSSGLYTDKIGSIVRELICNAYDSHIQANNLDTPIEIVTPTAWSDGVFKIKDYGTGLSEEDIFTVYTTYFKSTKNESNDYIGCLGLGSKSPFSYTDSFTVESRYNGTLTSYLCYKDDKGPAITKLESNPTDEHNGLTVTINVNGNDSAYFRDKSEQFLNLADINVIINGRKYDCFPGELFKKIDNIELYKDRYDNKIYIKQGIVCYPINNKLTDDVTFNQYVKILSAYKTIITVPIGSVEVTASREALSYDERTTKNVIDYIIEAGAAYMEDYKNSIKDLNQFEISFKFQEDYAELANAIKRYDLSSNIFPEFKIFNINKMFDEIDITPTWLRKYKIYVNDEKNDGRVNLDKYAHYNLGKDVKILFTSTSSSVGKHEKMLKLAKMSLMGTSMNHIEFILICCPKEIQQKFIDSFPGIEKFTYDLDTVKLDRKRSEKSAHEYKFKSLPSDYKDINFNNFNKNSLDDLNDVINYIPIEGNNIIGLECSKEHTAKQQFFKSIFYSNNSVYWQKKLGSEIYFLTTNQIKRLSKLNYKLINIIPLIYKKAYQIRRFIYIMNNANHSLKNLMNYKNLIKDKKLLRVIELTKLSNKINYTYETPYLDNNNNFKDKYIDKIFEYVYNKYKILKYLNNIDEDFFKLGYL